MNVFECLPVTSSVPATDFRFTRRRGFNYGGTSTNTYSFLTAAQLVSYNVKLIRSRPNTIWTHTATGVTWNSRAGGWTQPNNDSRVWEASINWSGAAGFDAFLEDMDAHDIRVVIDPHAFPGFYGSGISAPQFTMHANYYYWFNPQYPLNMQTYWDQVASHCASFGNVIAGYNIINEPQAPLFNTTTRNFPQVITSASLPTAAAQAAFPGARAADARWAVGDFDPRSYYYTVDLAMQAIRAHDTTHSIIIEAHGTGGDGFGAYQGRYSSGAATTWYCPNDILPIVFQIHAYDYFGNNTQDLYYATSAATGLNKASITSLFNYANNWLTGTAPAGTQMYVGEFGPDPMLTNSAGNILREKTYAKDYVSDKIQVFMEHGWGHTYHTVNNGGSERASPSGSPVFLAAMASAYGTPF